MQSRLRKSDSQSNMNGRNVRSLLLLLIAFLPASLTGAQSPADEPQYFQWTSLNVLPEERGAPHPGLAGAFSGVHNDALLIAGGANFPESPPWEGGKKKWSERIYVLEKDGSAYQWTDTVFRLPQPAGYGVSISLPEGVLCIGGTDSTGPVHNIYLLRWQGKEKKISLSIAGALPVGAEVTGGAVIGDRLYITCVSGKQNQFFSAELKHLLNESPFEWESLPAYPGPPRKFIAYAAQHDGVAMRFFVFGGRSESGTDVALLNDCYAFDFQKKKWDRIANLPEDAGPTLMGAPALAYGATSIFIFGGDNGQLFAQRQQLVNLKAASNDPSASDSLQNQLTALFRDHPGFSRKIYFYNTVTGTFTTAGTLPDSPPVTTNAVLWDDRVLLTSGETQPGIRTPNILAATLVKNTGSFGVLNYSLLAVYLVGLVIMGIYFSLRQKTTDDYFKGGGRVPWWAAGLSVFGTALSAITFMAIPAKTYATDWAYFFYNISILAVTPIIVSLFIPFFRRLDVTTAYEYLEKRFNVVTRLFGSASFILFQVGRIGIVLYLPAIALSIVSGIDIHLCIITMGILSLVYTLIGGIEAVVWTDVVQVFVLMGGTLLALILIFIDLEGSVLDSLQTAAQHDKFNLFNLEMSLIEPTFWVVFIGGFFANLITYSSDQAIVQRYLTTKTESGAGKSAWTNALLVIPATLFFFGVGTALYLYYLQSPEKVDPFATDIDAIFPWYIMQSLPDGVSGILIAGLFSAAMSTLSSSMNSAATAFTTDFYDRFASVVNQTTSLTVAKSSTFVVGIFGTLFAIWMSYSNIASLWDHFATILGLFTGGLGGLFVLGILSRQANGTGALIGLFSSGVIQYFVSSSTGVHIFMYAGVGLVSCVVIGHLASLVIPDNSNPEGRTLTVHNKLFARNK